ncbi:ATP-binding protein [Vibrio sp. TRT 17S01]|uniref:PAS domain-containing sensor histidine kinase n=1 Tax=Vibrio sp. TRT 17S01 TaxID=3418505 RepID=UPI003CF8F1C9
MSRAQRFEQGITNPFSSRLGRRIILILILLSGVITLLTTLLQLYWDYKDQFNVVEQRHIEVQTVHADLLATSIWNFDLVVLQERLEGLVNLPKIDYLEITSGTYSFNAGQKTVGDIVADTYPLNYHNKQLGTVESIGHIYVESNAQEIYNYLIKQFIVTLLLNAIKTLLVCTVILLVFHQSINRRLFKISHYLREYSPRHPPEQLKLMRGGWMKENVDELDWLGEETNRLTSNLTTLYRNIKQEKERLQDFAHVSSDWLWETNEYGNLIYCSDSMYEALGLSALDKPLFSDIPQLAHATNLVKAVARRNDFNTIETSITLHEVTQYLMFQAQARYVDDKFVGFRGSAINITDLKLTQLDLQALNQNLEHTVAERTIDLRNNMKELESTQEKLIESEKLAALGGLVAGVAHEVNTPLGISVTAASVIQDTTKTLNGAFESQSLTTDQFASLMQQITASSSMLEQNLNRASRLIRDFKQTAVDQVSESRSQFLVKQVLEALIASLHPETRKVPVIPQIEGDESIMMNSLPGVLTQVVSNLVMNSVNHAFEQTATPEILIKFHLNDNSSINLEYHDNGVGVAKELHHKIFEPFFTSKRGKGGSGLGLNLVFNLVNQKLKGTLSFHSEPDRGVHYTITLPVVLPSELNSKVS